MSMSLKDSINLLGRQVKNLKNKLTLPVTDDNLGLATPEMKINLDAIFKNRIHIDDGTDILTVPAGVYEGGALLNHPLQPTKITNWYSELEIYQRGVRKQFWLTDQTTGTQWKRTYYTDGSQKGTDGWIVVPGEQTLWWGDSDLKDAVTLAHPVTNADGEENYRDIRVYFKTKEGDYNFGVGAAAGVTLNITNNDNDGALSFNVYEAQLDFPTSTTAKVTRNALINVFGANGATDIDDAKIKALLGDIKILKIVGTR